MSQNSQNFGATTAMIICWLLVGITVFCIAIVALLEWEFGARNLEKYHCVNEDNSKNDPDSKGPSWYGYHVSLGGDKRGFITKKKRTFRITSAEYAEDFFTSIALSPAWYDANTCSSKTGIGYQFRHGLFSRPTLKVSVLGEGSTQPDEKIFTCDKYSNIHYHRYLAHNGHRMWIERDFSRHISTCVYGK